MLVYLSYPTTSDPASNPASNDTPDHRRAHICTKHIYTIICTDQFTYRMAADVHPRNVHPHGGHHFGPGDGMPARRLRAGLLHQNIEPSVPAVLADVRSWDVLCSSLRRDTRHCLLELLGGRLPRRAVRDGSLHSDCRPRL